MESVKITNRGEDIVSVLKRTDTIILISEMYFLPMTGGAIFRNLISRRRSFGSLQRQCS